MVPHPVVAPKAATPGCLTRPAAANRGKLAPRVRVPDTDRLSPCGSVSLRLSALAAVRLHSRHRVIGRRRLSEAPLARTVRSNDILQVSDAAGEPVDAGDNQHVPFSQEIEHGAQLRAVRRAGA